MHLVCFFHLLRLRPMRARLGWVVTLTLVTALVLLRLDYCNSVPAGLPPQYWRHYIHAAARLVNCVTTSPTLEELHWLPIKQLVDYKLCLLLVHKVMVGHALSYLTGMWLQLPLSHHGWLFAMGITAIMSSPAPVWNFMRGRSPFLRHCPSIMELAANRTQVDAFHASFQALLENILVPDCLL